jgi:hypothetical protein
MSDQEEIIKIIETFFEIGKSKKLEILKDYATTIALEELRFVSISDYDYKINNVKVSIFGETAVVALELVQKGMLVDNKAFTGEHITIGGRATFVLIRQPTWKIIHIHLSKSEN